MKRAVLMRRATFAAVAVWALAAAGPAFAGISDFAINRDASLAASDVQVTVTGNVMCPPGEFAFIGVQVTQIVQGKLITFAFGSAGSIACNGTVESWTVTASSVAPMENGRAQAVASAFAFMPPFTFEFATSNAEVKLQEIH